MKRIAVIIAAIIIFYSIYYDLTVGTLPHVMVASSHIINDQTSSTVPYTLIEIKSGDTVISIIEKMQQGPLPIPIDQLVQDFKLLNKDVKPEHIQVGQTYKFPIYHESHQ